MVQGLFFILFICIKYFVGMPRKMRKYYGKKTWTETLYTNFVDENEFEWRKDFPEMRFRKVDILEGDTEFYLPEIPYACDYGKDSTCEFTVYGNFFENTNSFITDTEAFNWGKLNRI